MGWYKQIIDPAGLRPQISLAIRQARKRITKEQKRKAAAPLAANNKKGKQRQQQQVLGTRTDRNYDNDNCNGSSTMGLDPRKLKRFKKEDDICSGFGGSSNSSFGL